MYMLVECGSRSLRTTNCPWLGRGQVMWRIKKFWGFNHITETAEPEVVKFYTQVGYINSGNRMISPTKGAWLWSRDCFKILPFVVLQRVARVCQRQLSYLLLDVLRFMGYNIMCSYFYCTVYAATVCLSVWLSGVGSSTNTVKPRIMPKRPVIPQGF